jgi:hypothetical protein
VVGQDVGMRSKAAHPAAMAVGVVIALLGLVFAGQGLNLIPGSFMTGNRMWLYIGVVMAVVGIILVVVGLRKRPAARR